MKFRITLTLYFCLTIGLFLFIYQSTVTAQNITPARLSNPCDPARLGYPITPSSTEESSRNNRARHGEIAMRWCFTFESMEGLMGTTGGSLKVIQHIILEEYTGRAWRQMNSAEFELACVKSGRVDWNAVHEFITFGGGKIECTTVDLRAETLKLSNYQYDICDGSTTCELAITEVVNYIITPSIHNAPFLNGPLFTYEEVKIGGRFKNNFALTFDLNNEFTQAPVYEDDLQDDTFFSIEQVGSQMLYGIDGTLTDRKRLINTTTYFNSFPETIYFGYDPATGDYLKGSIKNGIFDPYSGSGSAY